MRDKVSRVRDYIMLTLGAGGMVRELYLEPKPDLLRVTLSVCLLLGPAALLSWLSARTTPPPSAPPSPPLESSSPSSSS